MNNFFVIPIWYFMLACVVQFFLGQVSQYYGLPWFYAGLIDGVSLGIFAASADLFYGKGD